MSIDVLPGAGSHPRPLREHPRRDRPTVSRRRWLGPALLAIGAVAVVVPAAVLISGADSSREIGPQLTHTIQRRDLFVSLTAQGILESAESTEIKCKVRGSNTIIWVVESGAFVKPGDELVRLDTLFIEEQISERSKYAHWSRSAAERSKADVARGELAILEYQEGRYVTQLATLQKELAVAESDLRTARNIVVYTELMFGNGYASELDVEEKKFAVTRAKLDVELKKTAINVLTRFTKAEQMEMLKGNLAADKARNKANVERAMADASRRDRALEELKHCVIKAEKGGLVIHPAAARWENAPKIAEGVTVYKDQVLLLMPDLDKMQVKVGIRESFVDRVKPGLTARVALPDKTLEGEISSVASITRPASWWTGNVVKYDTIIQLPSIEGLKPGMSAEVEIRIARHENVLTIPVAAVVETEEGDFCWVKTAEGAKPRPLQLGDSNDVFTIVKAGLKEGDQVVLNPLALGNVPVTQSEWRGKEKTGKQTLE